MNPDETIKLVRDDGANALQLEATRVVYLPDDQHPICLVGYVKHIESRLRYHQVFKMSTDVARSLANALSIQANLGDPPLPDF